MDTKSDGELWLDIEGAWLTWTRHQILDFDMFTHFTLQSPTTRPFPERDPDADSQFRERDRRHIILYQLYQYQSFVTFLLFGFTTPLDPTALTTQLVEKITNTGNYRLTGTVTVFFTVTDTRRMPHVGET